MDIINWVVRAMNADWLTAVVYLSKYKYVQYVSAWASVALWGIERACDYWIVCTCEHANLASECVFVWVCDPTSPSKIVNSIRLAPQGGEKFTLPNDLAQREERCIACSLKTALQWHLTRSIKHTHPSLTQKHDMHRNSKKCPLTVNCIYFQQT